MTRRGLVHVFIILALAASARAAHGQRLTPGFPTSGVAALTTNSDVARPTAALNNQPLECRGHAGFRIAEGTLIGAAAGWLGYELTVGIWVSGEGAKPDAGMRRLRTSLILGGAAFGAARTIYMRHQCR
jgi:hypothetical protein